MKIRINKLILITGLVFFAVLIPLAQASATPPAMSTYCIQPPFLGSTTQPNVMIILDNSGSMNCLAYQSGYNPSQFVTGAYYGYFNPASNYKYTTTAGTPNRWIPTGDALTTGTTANPIVSGNLLNWITMSRQDVAKKILIGGKASPGTYALANRTTAPVKLYGNSDSNTNWTCTTNHKAFDSTSANIIGPFVGDYTYTVPTGQSSTSAQTFSIAFNDPALIRLRPNSNFSSSNPAYTFPAAWVKTGSGSAYEVVDETTSPGNTSDYIVNKSSTAPALFGYDHSNATLAAASGTISDVTVYAYAKKTGTAVVNLQGVLRLKDSSADLESASGLTALSTSWGTVSFPFTTNPQTGVAWQWSDLTGSALGSLLGFGVKASRSGGANPTTSYYPTVSQVYIQINVSAPTSGGPYNIIVDQGSTPAAGVLDTMSGEVRFGLANYNSSGDGGHIVASNTYVDFNSVPNIISSISDTIGSTTTPLAEALYEMVRYFRQDSSYSSYSSTDYIKGCVGATSGTSTCGAGAAPNTKDPYYYNFTDPTVPDTYVPCAKSFIIFMTDGEPYGDQTIPGSSTAPPYANCSLTNIKACSGRLCDSVLGTCTTLTPRYGGTAVGQTYPNSGADYMIDVAYWARTNDMRYSTDTDVPTTWRQGLPGTQNIFLYPIFLFGRNSTLLADASIYGGFDDLNGNGRPDCTTNPEECYRDSNGDGHIYSVRHNFCTNQSPTFATTCITDADCGGATCLEPDSPITYFEGDDGYQLEQSITDAINAILAKAASGTAASVLASGEGSGANLVQSIFYPKRSFVGSAEVTWIGTLSNMWYFIDPNSNNSTIREDTVADKTLKLTQDRIAEYSFNASTNETGMNLFDDANGDGVKDGSAVATASLDTLKYLWEAGRILFQRTAGDNNSGIYSSSARTIYTNTDDNYTLDPFSVSNESNLRALLGYSSDTSNLVRYIRGNDGLTFDLNNDGTAETLRSRTITVRIGGSDVTSVWKLGDVVNSTPKLVSWTPLNKYDEIYRDFTYKSFYSTTGYKNRGMVFVGGNDGMLHAFKLGLLGIYKDSTDKKATLGKTCSTDDTKACSVNGDCPSGTCNTDANMGKEAWAFIPKNSLPYLLYQANADYCHLYYVDSSPVIFDASINNPAGCTGDYWNCAKTVDSWRTVLIGSMRYGGACRSNGTACSECVTTPISGTSDGLSSYFALDITDPESPTLLWEYANSELGLSSTGPGIIRINSKTNCSVSTTTNCNYDGDCPSGEKCLQDTTTNGRWFVVLGSGPSGYVSPNTRQFMGVTEHEQPISGKGKIKLHVLDLKTGNLQANIDAAETNATAAFAGSFANATIDADLNYSDDALYFGYTTRNTLGTAGTAQAGSTANTIKLAATASATNGYYTGKFIHRNDLRHDTRMVISYDGSTKIATMDSDWKSAVPTTSTQYNFLDGWNTGGVKRLFTRESMDPSDWVVSTVIQTTGPVTGAVVKLFDTKNKILRLYFGTGRNFYKVSQIVDDASATRRLYGVKEPCYTTSGLDTSCTTTVVETSLGAADQSTNTDGSTDVYGNTNVAGSSDTDGWYIPLQSAYGANAAERSVTDPLATTIGVVFFTTTKPSTDVCTYGGKSYVWAVKYDTGGTVPSGVLKGKAMIQLSTGAIQEINLRTAFNAQGNRRTSTPMQGIPPLDQSLNVPISPKPINKILHMQKK